MEPNANSIFRYTDKDGDELEILAASSSRLTVGILLAGANNRTLAYLDRVNAALLRQSLGKWLDKSGAEPECPTFPSPVQLRIESLRIAASMAPGDIDRDIVFDAAEDIAWYIATGERKHVQGTDPVKARFIEMCSECKHPFHGTEECNSIQTAGVFCRCSCRGAQ